MHELGIVFHIIRTVEDVAKQNDVSRIRRVTLQLGEVSGVVESYLQDCWKWAAAKSEILPGAVLAVETIPAVTLCEDCGQQYPTVQYGRICPPLPERTYASGARERDDDQRGGGSRIKAFPLGGSQEKARVREVFAHAPFSYFSPSGKITLLTKKKITMDTPPFKTVVPML